MCYAVPRCSCWGVKLSLPPCATLELLNPPCEQDPSFTDHEVEVGQYNPLIWYVQHKLGGLLISIKDFFFPEKNKQTSQTFGT